MVEKLTFQEVQNTCDALKEFADARSAAQPDKDMILMVTKINGQETLQATKLSEMTWFARFVRWLGFGGATLNSVAHFLQSHEPYLPFRFCLLDRREILAYHYIDDDIDDVMDMDKETYRELKHQKRRGCEIFKRCVTHHNQSSYFQVYVLFQEYERVDLRSSGSGSNRGIESSWPNPMGPFHADNESKVREKHHIPIIDENAKEFLYLDPFFRTATKQLSPKVLGFCYEYGLGTKQDIDEALKNYRLDAARNEYSACYNLGRLLFEQNDFQGAIASLRQAEDILEGKINHAQQVVIDQQANPRKLPVAEHQENCKELEKITEFHLKKWHIAIHRVYSVLIEAHESNGDADDADAYRKKADLIDDIKDDAVI